MIFGEKYLNLRASEEKKSFQSKGANEVVSGDESVECKEDAIVDDSDDDDEDKASLDGRYDNLKNPEKSEKT